MRGPATVIARSNDPSVDASSAVDVLSLLATPLRRDRITHVETIPGRAGTAASWPAWADPVVVDRFRAIGVREPWVHQRSAADLLHRGESVIVATGTASGKTLAYLLPALDAIRRDAAAGGARGATVLYLAPTKALAADQLRTVENVAVPEVRCAAVDGDTSPEEREWARQYASYVLTNPDLLHHTLLPNHRRWTPFLRALRFVVVDEAHCYRGVFGAHVAQVLRRLQRICRHYGSDPALALASATVAEPAALAGRLLGRPVTAVAEDTAPRGRTRFVLWEPPEIDRGYDPAARGRVKADGARRSAVAEAADLAADLVAAGARTVAFVRSRRAAENVAQSARRRLDDLEPGLGRSVAAYRGGYLPEERRALEADLHAGRLRCLASTNALELGVDISGLDAVVMAGYPGSRASLWQQAGRAGRSRTDAVAVLVSRDDPFDRYLVHHPEAIFGAPIEQTVLDPDNPYVLGPHLAAAAAEAPLRDADLAAFGANAPQVVDALTEVGLLRRRPSGWYWTSRDKASALADLRGSGGRPVRVVESETGRLLGTVDAHAAPRTVHPGAVYVHQGVEHLVDSLDLDGGCALAHRADLGYVTIAREQSTISVVGLRRRRALGAGELCEGDVEVTAQVTGFVCRRAGTDEFLGEVPLDLPPRTLPTRATWLTVPADVLASAGVAARSVAGGVHAVEHAAVSLLPLVAACDGWDAGGASAPVHPDTGGPTVFVHDRYPGGAGFAERAYDCAEAWLTATRAAITDCSCADGCPSCVQTASCGAGNTPLSKSAATMVLDLLLGAGLTE
jgi:DEAD/DEAH box helicase domain-containing protein